MRPRRLGKKRVPGARNTVCVSAFQHRRQLKKGVAIRIVAANRNTSVEMIQKHYSRYITDHTDAITRAALLDTPQKPPENVIDLPQRVAS